MDTDKKAERRCRQTQTRSWGSDRRPNRKQGDGARAFRCRGGCRRVKKAASKTAPAKAIAKVMKKGKKSVVAKKAKAKALKRSAPKKSAGKKSAKKAKESAPKRRQKRPQRR